jgi:hypothetical protein
MQEQSPGAPPHDPPDASTVKARAVAAKKWLDAVFNWPPMGWFPVPTATSLFAVALGIVVIIELLPKGISDVTLSVRARTEVLQFDLDPARQYVWWLPGGSYSLLKAAAQHGCEARGAFDLICSSAEPTAVVISNGATVHLETLAQDYRGAARFSIVITPRPAARPSVKGLAPPAEGRDDAQPSMIEIRTADALLAQTHDLVTFESGPVDLWRIPLILKKVQIGEFLTESIAAADTLGGFRQPIMTEGSVRIFARSFGSEERYQVQEESFDPADVVQIPADRGREGLLLGLISLTDSDEQFDLTLHTDLAEVFVRRLGAEHRIGVSMWSIVSQLPFWLTLWVVLVSLLLVGNYYAQRFGALRGLDND